MVPLVVGGLRNGEQLADMYLVVGKYLGSFAEDAGAQNRLRGYLGSPRACFDRLKIVPNWGIWGYWAW